MFMSKLKTLNHAILKNFHADSQYTWLPMHVNHANFLEVTSVFSRVHPRPISLLGIQLFILSSNKILSADDSFNSFSDSQRL